jgi:exodeoxyribonuclease V gamma subunit
MLHIIQSNQLECLADHLAQDLSEHPLEVWTPEIIVVPSRSMGEWLTHQMAYRQGIAAHMEYMLPAKLAWEIARKMGVEIDSTSPYTLSSMTWAIYALCQKPEKRYLFAEYASYLQEHSTATQYYQFAEKLADAFDQYLIYRPDWISAWRQPSPDEPWQARLWRELQQQWPNPSHRVDHYETLLAKLQHPNAWDLSKLPKRISVFGIQTLPADTLHLLRVLGKYTDIKLLLFNPCRHYWFDLVNPKQFHRQTVSALAQKDSNPQHHEIGNTLLANWGKTAQQFYYALAELPSSEIAQDVDAFHAHSDHTASPNLLQQLQETILEAVELETLSIAVHDRSLQIHSCHSPLREVEVLHDQILRLLDQDGIAALTPRDIVVMVPNIASYAPYIHAVFSTHLPTRLPWSIADRTARQDNAYVNLLTALFDLPNERFSFSAVMRILGQKEVLEFYNISEQAFDELRQILLNSGIRWGYDENAPQANDLPIFGQNSWKFGLKRLLLGYTCSDTQLYQGILPARINSQQAEYLGRFILAFESLASWVETLHKPHPVATWQSLIKQGFHTLCGPDTFEHEDAQRIDEALEYIIQSASTSSIDLPIPLEVFRKAFETQIDTADETRGYLDYGITFCTFRPLRSVPFRVVCVLGMNDLDYPRRPTPNHLNLINQDRPRMGDRNPRQEDQQLFLEALLSARDVFYISYVGHNIRDNTPKNPSPLVAELCDHLHSHMGDRFSIIKHPLQPFSRRYFDNAAPDTLFTYRQEWQPSPAKEQRGAPEQIQTPPAAHVPHEIELDDFIAFFKNPAKFLLQQRLSIRWPSIDDREEDTEPTEISHLQQYHLLNERIQQHLSQTALLSSWRERQLAGGQLPVPIIAMQKLDEIEQQSDIIYQIISSHAEIILPKQEIQLFCNGYQIEGEITGLARGKGGLCVYQMFHTGALKAKHLMEAWIRHLVLSALGLIQAPSHIISLENKQPTLFSLQLDNKNSNESLSKLVEYYISYYYKPMSFIPDCAFAYAKALQKNADTEVAMLAAEKIWLSDKKSNRLDPFAARLFGDTPFQSTDFCQEFSLLSQDIFSPCITQLEKHKT